MELECIMRFIITLALEVIIAGISNSNARVMMKRMMHSSSISVSEKSFKHLCCVDGLTETSLALQTFCTIN